MASLLGNEPGIAYSLFSSSIKILLRIFEVSHPSLVSGRRDSPWDGVKMMEWEVFWNPRSRCLYPWSKVGILSADFVLFWFMGSVAQSMTVYIQRRNNMVEGMVEESYSPTASRKQ